MTGGPGASDVRPLTIGLQVPARTSGGGRVFFDHLVQELLAHPACPHVVKFVVGDLGDDELHHERLTSVSIVPTSTPSRERALAPRGLRTAARAHPVDVLLCPGTGLTRLPGVPVILWPLTVAPFERQARLLLGSTAKTRLRMEVLRLLTLRACHRADAAVFSSRYARDLYFTSSPRLRSVPTSVIWPAASLSATAPSTGIAVPDRPLLFVSHLYPYKMVAEMIEGYALARRTSTLESPLYIAGSPVDEDYQRHLERVVLDHEVGDYVVFLGNVNPEQLHDLYAQARAFIFPSISENAGSYALVDAFRYGLPLLSSTASSMPEMVGSAGMYFEPRSPETLAAALRHMQETPGLEATLSERSADRQHSFPDWTSLADSFYEFSRQVVANQHFRTQAEGHT